MKTNTKLAVLIAILILISLACATLAGFGDDGGNAGQANILFEDDFSSSGSGWDRYEDSEGLTDYSDGTYKIALYTNEMFYWANPYQNFTDVIIEVEAGKVSGGNDMQYGIICRHADIDNWYALVISADGYAAVRKRVQGNELDYIAEWVQVPSINTGNATNNLRAECIGDRLALYVNGSLAIEATDSVISSGDAGLMAGTFEQSSTEVIFDNFVVINP